MHHRNAIYNITGNIVFLFAQWIITVVVVRLSGYLDAGHLSVAITLTGIFYIISNYNTRVYQVADIDNKYSDQDYILIRLVTSFAGLLVCFLSTLFLGYNELQNGIILLYMLYKSGESLSDAAYGIFQKDDHFNYICVSMCAKGVAGITVFSAFMKLTANLSISILGMTIVIALIIVFYDYPRINRRVKPIVRVDISAFKQCRNLLMECFPLMLVLVSQPILQAIPRIYFEKRYSTELFGIYSSIAMPCAIITIFVSCAVLPYVPYFAVLYKGKENKKFLSAVMLAVGIIIAFGFASLIGAYFLGEWVLVLIFGEGVRPYAGVFIYVIVAMTCSAVIMAFNGIITAMHRFAALMVLSFGGCLICLLLSGFFIRNWQMYGIAYSMIVSQAIQIVVMAAFVLRYVRKNI